MYRRYLLISLSDKMKINKYEFKKKSTDFPQNSEAFSFISQLRHVLMTCYFLHSTQQTLHAPLINGQNAHVSID